MKQNEAKLVPAVRLGREELDEVLRLGAEGRIPTVELSYQQMQAYIIIEGLLKFMALYGIVLPLELKNE